MKQKTFLFLLTSIPYGILMGFFLGDEPDSVLKYGVISGIIFGLLMTVILFIIQRKSLKKLGQRNGNVKVICTAVIEIKGTRHEIFEICKSSLSKIAKCKLEESDFQAGVLKAKAGMTWHTWGDLILFKLEEAQENCYKVLVTSRPIVRSTVIDYGKNMDNINRIIELFKDMKGDIKVIQDGNKIT